jgi:single-strand DNA-binding protein
MNKVILMGRLVRDPEIRYGHEIKNGSDSGVAKYTLAVDRKFDREKTDFINCVVFGKQVEFVQRYLRQGVKIAVVGRIQTGSYTNREGQKVYTTDVVVEEQEFAESKKADVPQANPSAYTKVDSDGFMDIPDDVDDMLPF